MPEQAGATSTADAAKTGAEPSLDNLLVSEGADAGQADSGQPTADATPDAAASTAENAPVAEDETFDESTILSDGLKTDFSDEVYAKYAKHFSKQFGKEIDPSDPFNRAMLHELISRGQKIASVAAPTDADEDGGEAEESETQPAETKPEVPVAEQIKNYQENIAKLAKDAIVPEVALPWIEQNLAVLIGDAKAKALPAEAKLAYVQNLMAGQLMFFDTFLPKFLPKMMSQFVGNEFPLLSEIHADRLEQRAFSDLAGKKGKNGQPVYPDLGKMKDAVFSVLEELPWLKEGEFKDANGKPFSALENRKYIIGEAYKIARGKAPSSQVVAEAAQKGKEQAVKAQAVAAASKLAAGESKGAFQPQGDDLLNSLKKYQEGTPENKAAKEMGRSAEFKEWSLSRGRK